VKRSARLALELMTPQRVLAPLQALALPCNLARQGLERAWELGRRFGHAAGRWLGLARPEPVPSGIEAMKRQIREHEASDPQDLRELVAMRADLIREVFTGEEEPLVVLQPVQEALVLPDGRRHPLQPIPATPEAIEEAVYGLEDICLEVAEKNHGRSFERNDESLFVAETWFRAGYGLKPIGREELERGWPERLGRLQRQGWDLLVDRAMNAQDRAQRVLDARAESAGREELRGKPLVSPIEVPRREKPREPERPAVPKDEGRSR
jgi:hypothetical protein